MIQRINKVREFIEERQKTLASVGICLMAVFMAYHVFTANNGIKAYFQKRTEHRVLQQEVERMKLENAELAKRVHSLKSDPQTIEQEAREQLKYAKPGEVVFVSPETTQQTPSTATAQKNSGPSVRLFLISRKKKGQPVRLPSLIILNTKY